MGRGRYNLAMHKTDSMLHVCVDTLSLTHNPFVLYDLVKV